MTLDSAFNARAGDDDQCGSTGGLSHPFFLC